VTIEFGPGLHINEAARQLCDAARANGRASGSFNDIPLHATASTTPASIVACFERITAERAEAYRRSPEGIAAAGRANTNRQAMQATHDRLMVELPSLDWSNHGVILDWLCAMQAPSDHVGVIIRKQTIAAAFLKQGFEPGMDCGRSYQQGVKNSEFRYLVGQALDGIVNGPAIHPILHKFSDEWRARWAKAGAATPMTTVLTGVVKRMF
jgi:hypothetical protein